MDLWRGPCHSTAEIHCIFGDLVKDWPCHQVQEYHLVLELGPCHSTAEIHCIF
jgi:hypothetical protein